MQLHRGRPGPRFGWPCPWPVPDSACSVFWLSVPWPPDLTEVFSDGWFADARCSAGWWVVVLSEAKTDTENTINANTKTVTAIFKRLMDALPLLLWVLSSCIQCLFSHAGTGLQDTVSHVTRDGSGFKAIFSDTINHWNKHLTRP